MKTKIYLRVGKTSRTYKVEASTKPTQVPLSNESSYFPTVFFSINIDIPDEAFEMGESAVKEINLKLKESLGICADVEELKPVK